MVCFAVSSVISATYNNAVTAHKLLPERDITVIATQSVSLGQGFMTVAAAEAAQQGASKKECITCALDTRARSHLFAALATVKYLAMSGRVGTVSTDLTPGLSVHTGAGLVGVAIVAGPSYQPPTQAANFDTASQVGSPCVFRWRQLSLSK